MSFDAAEERLGDVREVGAGLRIRQGGEGGIWGRREVEKGEREP